MIQRAEKALTMMLFELGWQLLVILLLVCANGFFVAAEFAIVKIRGSQLKPLLKIRGLARADGSARGQQPGCLPFGHSTWNYSRQPRSWLDWESRFWHIGCMPAFASLGVTQRKYAALAVASSAAFTLH